MVTAVSLALLILAVSRTTAEEEEYIDYVDDYEDENEIDNYRPPIVDKPNYGILSTDIFCKKKLDFKITQPAKNAFAPSGIVFWILDEPGIEYFELQCLHNKKLSGYELGDLRAKIVEPNNGKWTAYFPHVRTRFLDFFHCWVKLIKDKKVYRISHLLYYVLKIYKPDEYRIEEDEEELEEEVRIKRFIKEMQKEITTARHTKEMQEQITTERYTTEMQKEITSERYTTETQEQITTERYTTEMQKEITAARLTTEMQEEITSERYTTETQEQITTERHITEMQEQIKTENYTTEMQKQELSSEEDDSNTTETIDASDRDYFEPLGHCTHGGEIYRPIPSEGGESVPVPSPVFEIGSREFTVWVPDSPGISSFRLDMNIDKPFAGSEKAELTYLIVEPNLDKWTVFVYTMTLEEGEQLYFLLDVVRYGKHHRLSVSRNVTGRSSGTPETIKQNYTVLN